ncbi:MAG: hypothetical protein E4G99_00095 [Anaerolineales bacterium]|nr:MAG: hypothetical protein E4G99_00095 [Anaerolineales bacterium]
MNQVFPILILTMIAGICLIALFVTVYAFFTRILERTKSVAAERAGRSLLTGLVNAFFMAAAALALLAIGQNSGSVPFVILAILISVVLLLVVLFGITAMVLLLKERLFPGQLGNKPMAQAGTIAILACLTPYIGWFGLFPYLGFRGLGAFVIALVEARRERRQAVTAGDVEDD